MRIGMVGVGYVGLVTGACFAEMGNDVTCYDIDKKKISRLEKGIIPIYEPGLSEMVLKNFSQGRLRFTTNIKETVADSFVIFLAVGTPSGRRGEANLQGIFDASKKLAGEINSYKIIVTKSTVPVGTTEKVEEIIRGNLPDPSTDIDVVNNPEFLKEGAAVADFMLPDRIVIGCSNARVGEIMKELYAPFSRRGEKIILMNIRSSEMTKYSANAMLATRISFMNEIGKICDAVGADVESVRKGIGSDPRIGNKFLYPGIGFGGSCFPKDLRALIATAKNYKVKPGILDSVVKVNRDQRAHFFNKIKKYYRGKLSGKKFAVWGISFKPKTDDIREAPSLEVMASIMEGGGKIRAYDPVAMENGKTHFRGERSISFGKNNYEVLKNADGLIIFTEWAPFREPDFEKIMRELKKPVIFDGRNLYNPERLRKMGFDYICVGR